MAVGLAGAAIDDLGVVLAFTVGVDASVEGVLQHRNYVAIADRRPVKRDQLLAVRRARDGSRPSATNEPDERFQAGGSG